MATVRILVIDTDFCFIWTCCQETQDREYSFANLFFFSIFNFSFFSQNAPDHLAYEPFGPFHTKVNLQIEKYMFWQRPLPFDR